jgi:protein-tyrosine kinase
MTRLYNALQQYQKRLDSGAARGPLGAEMRQGVVGGVGEPRPAGAPIPDAPPRPVAASMAEAAPIPDAAPMPEALSMPDPASMPGNGYMPGDAAMAGASPIPDAAPSSGGGPMPGASRPRASMPGAGVAGKVSRLITTTLPRENLLSLYGAIEQRLSPDAPRIVQVTSATKGEGTTTVARDLAVTIADTVRKRVLLISVMRPGVDNFAAAAPVGLEAVMTGTANQGDVIEAVPGLPLFETTLNIVGIGNGHLFDAPAMDRALRSALSLVDFVILDTPPVLNGFIAPALARHAGGTVLVVEAERVRAPKVQEARRTIEAHGGRIIGAVMNKRRWHIPEIIYRRLQ